MAARSVLELLAVVFAFVAAMLLATVGTRALQRAEMRKARADSFKELSGSGLAHLLRNGIPPLAAPARALCRFAPIQRFVESIAEWVSANWSFCSEQSASTLALGCVVFAGGVASVVAANPVAGLAVAALIVVVVATRIQSWRDGQLDAMRDGVPAALNTMCECFQAGYSLMQTMQAVADQSEGKLKTLFAGCANAMSLGGTSREALERLRGAQHVEELSFVAVALDVQHQSGGSMASVLGSAQQLVADRVELRRSLRVQTAQARLSARVICVMPFVLIAILSLMSKDFLAPFFSSFAGEAMLAVALLLEAGGVVIVRRMLKVDV